MPLYGYDTEEAVCGELSEENRKLCKENAKLKEEIKMLKWIIKVLKRKKKADVGISTYKEDKEKDRAIQKEAQSIRILAREVYWKNGLKVIACANRIIELTGGWDEIYPEDKEVK